MLENLIDALEKTEDFAGHKLDVKNIALHILIQVDDTVMYLCQDTAHRLEYLSMEGSIYSYPITIMLSYMLDVFQQMTKAECYLLCVYSKLKKNVTSSFYEYTKQMNKC